MSFPGAFASVVDLGSACDVTAGFGVLGFGGGNGLTIAFKIDFKSADLDFAASFTAGFADAFLSDFAAAAALSLLEAVLRSVVCFFVTASSVLMIVVQA